MLCCIAKSGNDHDIGAPLRCRDDCRLASMNDLRAAAEQSRNNPCASADSHIFNGNSLAFEILGFLGDNRNHPASGGAWVKQTVMRSWAISSLSKRMLADKKQISAQKAVFIASSLAVS